MVVRVSVGVCVADIDTVVVGVGVRDGEAWDDSVEVGVSVADGVIDGVAVNVEVAVSLLEGVAEIELDAEEVEDDDGVADKGPLNETVHVKLHSDPRPAAVHAAQTQHADSLHAYSAK